MTEICANLSLCECIYIYPRVPLSLKILGGGVCPVCLSLNPRLTTSTHQSFALSCSARLIKKGCLSMEYMFSKMSKAQIESTTTDSESEWRSVINHYRGNSGLRERTVQFQNTCANAFCEINIITCNRVLFFITQKRHLNLWYVKWYLRKKSFLNFSTESEITK